MMITSEQWIIASSTFAVCILGLTFNSMALFLLFRLPDMRNAFGYMCTSHITSNIGVLLCFLFWGVPMTLTKSELSHGNVGKAVAAISILFWEVSIYSHVFVALNRFVAIYMPMQYKTVFGKRTAIMFIVLSWIIALGYCLPFLFHGCGFHYRTDSYLWLHDDTPCSQWIAKWMDFYSSCFWVVVIAISDILNLIKIVSMWKSLHTASVTSRRKRREIMFFAQAFCQNIIFTAATCCFPNAIYWVSDTFCTYLLTTFLWGAVHAIDGLILTAFNVGMHRKKVMANLNSLFKHDSLQSSNVAPVPHIQRNHEIHDSAVTTQAYVDNSNNNATS